MRGAGTDRGEQKVNMKIKGLPLLATLFLAGRLLEEISKALDGYAGGDGVLLLLRDILSGVMVWVLAGGILLGRWARPSSYRAG